MTTTPAPRAVATPADPTTTIRVARPDDAPAIQAIYAPIVASTMISFELEPPSIDAMAERIATTLARYPWFVSEDADGRVDGYVYASRYRERAAYRWSVDVTAYVREDRRGHGVGKRLYGRLFETLADLGYHQAFAIIALPNPASVALHESVGFVPIGIHRDVAFKHGRWHDTSWWQRRLKPPSEPHEPRPFAGGAAT